MHLRVLRASAAALFLCATLITTPHTAMAASAVSSIMSVAHGIIKNALQPVIQIANEVQSQINALQNAIDAKLQPLLGPMSQGLSSITTVTGGLKSAQAALADAESGKRMLETVSGVNTNQVSQLGGLVNGATSGVLKATDVNSIASAHTAGLGGALNMVGSVGSQFDLSGTALGSAAGVLSNQNLPVADGKSVSVETVSAVANSAGITTSQIDGRSNGITQVAGMLDQIKNAAASGVGAQVGSVISSKTSELTTQVNSTNAQLSEANQALQIAAEKLSGALAKGDNAEVKKYQAELQAASETVAFLSAQLEPLLAGLDELNKLIAISNASGPQAVKKAAEYLSASKLAQELPALNKLREFSAELWSDAKTLLGKIDLPDLGDGSSNFPNMMEVIKDMQGLAGKISGVVSGGVTELQGYFQTAKTKMHEIVNASGLGNIGTAISTMNQKIAEFNGTVQSGITSAISQAQAAIAPLSSQLGSFLSQADGVIAQFKGVFDQIKQVLQVGDLLNKQIQSIYDKSIGAAVKSVMDVIFSGFTKMPEVTSITKSMKVPGADLADAFGVDIVKEVTKYFGFNLPLGASYKQAKVKMLKASKAKKKKLTSKQKKKLKTAGKKILSATYIDQASKEALGMSFSEQSVYIDMLHTQLNAI